MKREHIDLIENYLDQQGLTFKPLRVEMKDHLIGDLEAQIENGVSFEKAWELITGEIPNHHFKNLQQEVMDTLNKKFNPSRAFSYLSLILIFTLVLFKILHFPLLGILLLATFGSIGATLFSGAVFSLYPFKNKKESLLLLGVVIGIGLFLLSFFAQIKGLPGVAPLRTTSVVILLILFPTIILYLGQKGNNEEYILTHIHKNNSPGIERFLLILLVLAVGLRLVSIAFESTPDVSNVLLFLVIGGAGLHFFALNWHSNKHDQGRQSWWLQAGLVFGFICFILPILNNVVLSYNIRIVVAACFYLIAGLIILARLNKHINRTIALTIVIVVSMFHIVWLLINLNILDPSLNSVIFNLMYMLFLLGALIYTNKHKMFYAYMTMVFARYMLEYPNQLGLW